MLVLTKVLGHQIGRRQNGPSSSRKVIQYMKKTMRTITVQPIFNVFEQLLSKQLYHAINDILSEHLTAYRKRNSCEIALIKLTEHWRTAL